MIGVNPNLHQEDMFLPQCSEGCHVGAVALVALVVDQFRAIRKQTNPASRTLREVSHLKVKFSVENLDTR